MYRPGSLVSDCHRCCPGCCPTDSGSSCWPQWRHLVFPLPIKHWKENFKKSLNVKGQRKGRKGLGMFLCRRGWGTKLRCGSLLVYAVLVLPTPWLSSKPPHSAAFKRNLTEKEFSLTDAMWACGFGAGTQMHPHGWQLRNWKTLENRQKVLVHLT